MMNAAMLVALGRTAEEVVGTDAEIACLELSAWPQ